MKKGLFSLLAIIILIGLINCDIDNSTDGERYLTKPEADSASDNQETGVYKGVFIGSTGYFILYIKNGNDVVRGVVQFEGVEIELTCSGLANYSSGPIVEAEFVGTYNGGNFSLTISVESDLTFIIDGRAYMILATICPNSFSTHYKQVVKEMVFMAFVDHPALKE